MQNPSNVAPQGLADKAEYSEEKRAEFKQYSWIPVRDPQVRRAGQGWVGRAGSKGLGWAAGHVVKCCYASFYGACCTAVSPEPACRQLRLLLKSA